VGIGAASSNTVGGWLVGRFSFSASFLGLAGIAVAAIALLYLAVPETLSKRGEA
jgi:predicted MFS family arabinose efflux permease